MTGTLLVAVGIMMIVYGIWLMFGRRQCPICGSRAITKHRGLNRCMICGVKFG